MIPVNTPLLSGNELKYVTDCIKTGWISSEGSYITKFEENFANYIGRKHGIAVSNGSAALDIAIKAIDLQPGDEVIMPTFTIISPAQSIVTAGGIPVLVDSDLDNWNMCTSEIEAKITKKTKAILVVHIYGLPVDMDPIIDICNKYNLILIEDAAEMHGQTYFSKKCGTFGRISIFSFYPNKLITTGEGGMILCDDELLNFKCRKYRNLCFDPNGRRFIHDEIGWNYRMTNLQAALGVAQLENIDKHILKKREIGNYYNTHLQINNKFKTPIASNEYANNIYWVYGLVADNEEYASETINYLTNCGIATRPFFWCIHEQPVFKKMGLFMNECYPNAEKLSRNGFYLPSGLGLSENDLNFIVNKINIWVKN